MPHPPDVFLDLSAAGDGDEGSPEERAALEETAARLAFASPPRMPAASLRNRLMQGISAGATQVWREWADTPHTPVHVVAAGQGQWEPIDIEGIRVKRLYVDPVEDSVALLIQMDPGAEYPAHRHAGAEHCYVIAGELEANGVQLRTGDYQVATTGSLHTITRSPRGCTILIISSMRDELA